MPRLMKHDLTHLNAIGPRKATQKTFTQKLTHTFATLNPFGGASSTPTSRLFARVPPSTFILLTGLDGNGKTTLLRDYLAPRPDSIQTILPKLGIHLEELQVGPAFFQATDIGGCKPVSYRRFDEELFKRADAVVYMVDAADRDRAIEARELMLMCGLRANNGGMRPGVPLLVLATKVDVENARRPDQIETYFIENIETSIGDRPTKAAGVNLKTGEGVEEALSWLSNELLKYKSLQRSRVDAEQKVASTEKADVV